LPSDTSSSQTSLAREVREALGEFKKSLASDLKVVSDGLDALESRSGVPVEPSSPDQCQEEEDDTLSMVQGVGRLLFSETGGLCCVAFKPVNFTI
jgi:hypothetical protein